MQMYDNKFISQAIYLFFFTETDNFFNKPTLGRLEMQALRLYKVENGDITRSKIPFIYAKAIP